MIEILTLTLAPGSRERFHQIYLNEALPLLSKWNFQVVAHGPSLHDKNSYYVIRKFKSLGDRQKEEDAYYVSEDWRKGPREAIVTLIDYEAYTVVPAEALTDWIEAIRKGGVNAGAR